MTRKPTFRIVVAATGAVFSDSIPAFADFETAYIKKNHIEEDLKRIGHRVTLSVGHFA